jgi:hypothetical protein
MREWIAGAMAVLGTLLVISGGAVIIVKAVQPSAPPAEEAEQPAPARAEGRLFTALRGLPAADRLIGWGVVLLVLGAIATGAINFNIGANTP